MKKEKEMIEMFPDESAQNRARQKWKKLSKEDDMRVLFAMIAGVCIGLMIVFAIIVGWAAFDTEYSPYIGLAILFVCALAFAFDIWIWIRKLFNKIRKK